MTTKLPCRESALSPKGFDKFRFDVILSLNVIPEMQRGFLDSAGERV